jgi:hypothetical protein|tara:strand:+ start:603 stop:890 length:288 start_codon:yes stop_codon:yes gene_type:complete
MNHQAIYNTHPTVVRVDDSTGAFDADGNSVAIDQSLVDAEVARLQAEHDSKAYARARADAYASIGDQLDMQYHDSVNGSRTWLDHIEAVKEAHPK